MPSLGSTPQFWGALSQEAVAIGGLPTLNQPLKQGLSDVSVQVLNSLGSACFSYRVQKKAKPV